MTEPAPFTNSSSQISLRAGTLKMKVQSPTCLTLTLLRTRTSDNLKQEKYISNLVETYLPDRGPLSFHKSQAPAADNLPMLVADALRTKPERAIDDKEWQTYQTLVGDLLYCSTQMRPDVAYCWTQMRPDVAYAVVLLYRAMSCPKPLLLAAARNALMYLLHHKSVGLRYQHSREPPRWLLRLRLGDAALHLGFGVHLQPGGNLMAVGNKAI
eukprot:6201307-Pleurochrysis_carterae.AAC.1